MTPERLRQITSEIIDRNTLTRMLGYRSNNSVRQWESGKCILPAIKAQWIEAYVEFRTKQMEEESAWIARNPPPTPDND